jgi:hypothetical protein
MNWQLIRAKIRGSYKSFVVWINGLAGAAVAGLPMLQDNLPGVMPYIPPRLMSYVQGFIGTIVFINILLRLKTNKGLESK